MQSVRNLARPECLDISRSLTISGVVEIVIIAIIFIMLIFTAAYNNMYKPDPGIVADVEKKAKYMNGMIISSAVLSCILLIVGIWHIYVANRAKGCIEKSTTLRT